jgi:hypothetical protein
MTAGCMIEKVAHAIAAAQGETNWRVHLDAARAAVFAMREPSTDMLNAAVPNLPDWGYLPDEWQAMIDYVAAEQPT